MSGSTHKDFFSEIPKSISEIEKAVTQLTLNSATLLPFAHQCDTGMKSGSDKLYEGLKELENQIAFIKRNIRKRQTEIYNHKKKLRQIDENDEVIEPSVTM